MAKATVSTLGGGFRFFSVAGINVYLHWSWLLVAAYEVSQKSSYRSQVWNALEYLALFLIVLLHEFGHALACRSVGGEADQIMLWPLGGVAYVRPPQRPGAVLWSIVAGPLVNVALLPITIGAYMLFRGSGLSFDIQQFLWRIAAINVLLLAFNMLPIYPLDGGKILQALLWFVFGQARSLMIASTLGIICTVAGVAALFIFTQGSHTWLLIMAVFAISQSWAGLQYARALGKMLALPKHENYHCPACRQAPPMGMMWRCRCGNAFDVFAAGGVCPACGERVGEVRCPFCGLIRPFYAWSATPGFTPLVPPPVPGAQPEPQQ